LGQVSLKGREFSQQDGYSSRAPQELMPHFVYVFVGDARETGFYVDGYQQRCAKVKMRVIYDTALWHGTYHILWKANRSQKSPVNAFLDLLKRALRIIDRSNVRYYPLLKGPEGFGHLEGIVIKTSERR
jgi:hypothetical protein